MAYKYRQGFFKPHRPEKYAGKNPTIVYRSSWELRVMRYLDQEPAILKWASEELAIPYIHPVDQEYHRYFPDFTVQLKAKDGIRTEVWEVKPKNQAALPRQRSKVTHKYLSEVVTYAINDAKWKAAIAYCEKKQWKFRILTEDDLFGKADK